MRVLYLTPGVFDKGGVSRYGRFQIQALRDLLGADHVTALSLWGPGGGASDLETPFVVEWQGRGFVTTPFGKARFMLEALRCALQERPAVVWAAHLHFASFAWLLSRMVGGVSVAQVYGYEVWTQRRHRPDVQLALSHCDYVMSDCHFSADYAEENFRLRRPTEVLWDCVDTTRLSPCSASAQVRGRYGIPDPDAGFNILTLGRLSFRAAYKGYARLLEIMPRLPEPAHLIFGGGGDMIPELRRRAAELGISARVAFTGFIDEHDLPDVYRSASVFALVGDCGPDRGEGIPLTPLEAAACGVPILVGNQDGSREAVEQGVNGFALDPFDLDQIAAHLTLLMENRLLRRSMGHAARLRIEREHSYPTFRTRMERSLERIATDTCVAQ